MKVSLINKQLWHEYSKVISVVAGILFLILTFIDFEQELRIKIALYSIGSLVLVFEYM